MTKKKKKGNKTFLLSLLGKVKNKKKIKNIKRRIIKKKKKVIRNFSEIDDEIFWGNAQIRNHSTWRPSMHQLLGSYLSMRLVCASSHAQTSPVFHWLRPVDCLSDDLPITQPRVSSCLYKSGRHFSSGFVRRVSLRWRSVRAILICRRLQLERNVFRQHSFNCDGSDSVVSPTEM